jgi:predicted small metal-binding protein
VWYIYSLKAARSTLVGGGVTKSFSCAHGGVVCGATIKGDTEDEVLAKAVEHAREAHGVDLSQSTTLAAYARSLIREDGEPER